MQIVNLRFELTDHLGNVRAVMGGTKDVMNKPTIFFLADYYAFGMPMPQRQFVSEEYRFGFNGQERDNEIAGTGNSYSAEFWQYDSRLGRRWNTEPIFKAWESSYACFSNSPIYYSDPSGAQSEGENVTSSSGVYEIYPESGMGPPEIIETNLPEVQVVDYANPNPGNVIDWKFR